MPLSPQRSASRDHFYPNAAHIADHNILHAAHLTQSADAVPRLINVTDPPPEVSPTGAVGDDSTDNATALQAMLDWLKGRNAHTHWLWFPFQTPDGTTAVYRTSKPLRVWTNTRMVGPATIAPTDDFDWTTHPYASHADYNPSGNATPGDIALLELWNDVNGRGSFSRMFIEDLTLNCKDQAGSIGALTKMQQPGYTRKFRIDNADVGWVLWGQQSDHFMAQIDDCDVGLYLSGDVSGNGHFGTGCKFMSFYTLNIEGYEDTAIRTNCDGPNWFHNCHFEHNAGGTVTLFDAQDGSFSLHNGWATHGGDANHVFVIGDKTPTPGPKTTQWEITNFRMSGTNQNGQLFIDDKVRSYTRAVDLYRFINHAAGLFQNDTQVDYDAAAEWIGDDGGFVRIGGLRGGTAAPTGHSGAQFTVQANGSQDEPMVRFRDSAGTTRFAIDETGLPTLPTYDDAGRPAATAVPAGTVIHNTDDNAPNVSDGTNWRDMAGVVT